ncbi:type II toxin-antitoxin system RelE/ParE family toxin [Planctomicrobium piriforme]|uniref:Plasmid stabilization system protein ParE n=1 Tax=Planctomicrobium piriforme TaxID=1576369 RepID=A0A1I3KZW2_9PLAN|nr:type II toxin-antitoxin system RelE/ParE family toxin [Planctomicrobium piriforme]SFI78019.1 Plasmid stabilization system protein ParE [Planctomicrobium piriforme]
MTAKLIFAVEAEEDLDAAYAWYESRRRGLGEEFLSCIDACIQRIQRMPEAYPRFYENFRRVIVRRFPYVIFYDSSGSLITVYAVFHTSLDPDRWQNRLS